MAVLKAGKWVQLLVDCSVGRWAAGTVVSLVAMLADLKAKRSVVELGMLKAVLKELLLVDMSGI